MQKEYDPNELLIAALQRKGMTYEEFLKKQEEPLGIDTRPRINGSLLMTGESAKKHKERVEKLKWL